MATGSHLFLSNSYATNINNNSSNNNKTDNTLNSSNRTDSSFFVNNKETNHNETSNRTRASAPAPPFLSVFQEPPKKGSGGNGNNNNNSGVVSPPNGSRLAKISTSLNGLKSSSFLAHFSHKDSYASLNNPLSHSDETPLKPEKQTRLSGGNKSSSLHEDSDVTDDEEDGEESEGEVTAYTPINISVRSATVLEDKRSPQQQIVALQQEIADQQQIIEKLQKSNKMLIEECEAVKKLLTSNSSQTENDNNKINNNFNNVTFSVVKVGYLNKRGLNFRSWCTRWCILRWNTLTYFKSPSDERPRGMFQVNNAVVEENYDSRRSHLFTVKSRNRLWYFQASTEYEQKSWMAAINMASKAVAETVTLKSPMKQRVRGDLNNVFSGGGAAGSNNSNSGSSPLNIGNTPPNHNNNNNNNSNGNMNSPRKNRKLLQFFGEAPSKDWSEDEMRPDLQQNVSYMSFGPIIKPIEEFANEKELNLLREVGLELIDIHGNYDIFLYACYFVTRDRYFKTRAGEYKELIHHLHLQKEAENNSSMTQGSWSKAHRPPIKSASEATIGRHLRHCIISEAAISRIFQLKNPRDYYNFVGKIGKGGFSKVYSAKGKESKHLVAIKVMSQTFEKQHAEMASEIALLKTCVHPNIIGYVESYLFEDKIYLVTEFCDVGTLDRIMKVEVEEPVIAHILQQVLHGLVYLHNQKRVHRDIKCNNILLTKEGGVKIADLGLCEELIAGPVLGKMSGSKYWLAPEIIARKPYDYAVDVWNVGILGYSLATKTPPYSEYHPIKAMCITGTRGINLSRLEKKTVSDFSVPFREFLQLCFTFDAGKRPTAAELLEHAFIGKACSKPALVAHIRKSMIIDEFFVA